MIVQITCAKVGHRQTNPKKTPLHSYMNRAAFRRVQNILFRIESMNCAEHTRKLLDMVYRTGAPRFSDLDPLQARRSFEKLHHAFGFERMPVASVVDVPILPGLTMTGMAGAPQQSMLSRQQLSCGTMRSSTRSWPISPPSIGV